MAARSLGFWIAALPLLISGCTLSDVYHMGVNGVEEARLAASINIDPSPRFRLHPNAALRVNSRSRVQSDVLTHAQSGVARVFRLVGDKEVDDNEVGEKTYELLLAWSEDVPEVQAAADSSFLEVTLGGLFEVPRPSRAGTMTVQLHQGGAIVSQHLLRIKPSLWQGDWNTGSAVEAAFHRFALELRGS